jgi:hypothetical protein
MHRIGWQAPPVATTEARRSGKSELTGGDLSIMLATQILGIAVLVCATMIERPDVVHNRGERRSRFL